MECGPDVTAAYTIAGAAMVKGVTAVDAREGIDAFLTRRPPKWL
jgi:hypothetical protein